MYRVYFTKTSPDTIDAHRIRSDELGVHFERFGTLPEDNATGYYTLVWLPARDISRIELIEER